MVHDRNLEGGSTKNQCAYLELCLRTFGSIFVTRDAAQSGPEFSDKVTNRDERSSSDFCFVVVRVTLAAKVSIKYCTRAPIYIIDYISLYASEEICLYLRGKCRPVVKLYVKWSHTSVDFFDIFDRSYTS